MAGKTLVAAKQQREKFLLEFQSACDDLEEETTPPGGRQPNVRKLKNKMSLVRSAYDDVLETHAEVITLEKTSASDEVNRNWVKINLRNSFKKVIEAAEGLLDTLGEVGDIEAETKIKTAEVKRVTQFELATLEAKVTATVQSLTQVIEETTIWLKDNHGALTESVVKLEDELMKKHLTMGENYLKLLEATEAVGEGKRQQQFRTENSPKVAELQVKLMSKTPTRGNAQQPAVQPQVAGVGNGQQEAQQQIKHKMKMAAMPIPKFSGKVVDYPEWKKLFKDCVESQYEESAAVMILRTQALPESLVSLVPRCTDLASVWVKLDDKFLDPARVWKGVKADLKSLDRKKLGEAKYMVSLVNKLMDAEILLETVGMVHWLRQEDKIPEYEDFLSREELLEWIRLKPKLTGTPWENFKSFLLKMKKEYEELARAGTTMEDRVEPKKEEKGCDYCRQKNKHQPQLIKFWGWKNHSESNCKNKSAAKEVQQKSETDKNHGKLQYDMECWKCGGKGHMGRYCRTKVDHSNNHVKKNMNKDDHETYSNYLRAKDCRWCNRTYNSSFTCSGCSIVWTAKVNADHCLAHCGKYSGASAKERGEMVLKGGNCLICLHHEHTTESCFGKDQQRSICGMEGCKKKHHPSLHSAPQSTIQAVKTTIHFSVKGSGETDPGVPTGKLAGAGSGPVSGTSGCTTLTPLAGQEGQDLKATMEVNVMDKLELQGRFMSRGNAKRVNTHK